GAGQRGRMKKHTTRSGEMHVASLLRRSKGKRKKVKEATKSGHRRPALLPFSFYLLTSSLRRHDPDLDSHLALNVVRADAAGPPPGQHLLRVLGCGQPDRQRVGVEVFVRLAVDPDFADLDAAGREDIRRDAQDIVREGARFRLEVEVHRL